MTPTAHLKDGVFVLTLPFFTPEQTAALSPHAKGKSSFKKQAATKQQRQTACILSRSVAPDEPWDNATLSIRLFYPTRKQRDFRNDTARLKGAIDGIVDGGVIVGDHWEVLRPGNNDGARHDPANPRIEIEVRRAEVVA